MGFLYIIIKVIPVHSTDSQPERAFVNFLVKLYLSAFSRMDSVMTVAFFIRAFCSTFNQS